MNGLIKGIMTLLSALCLIGVVLFDPGIRACVIFIAVLFVAVCAWGLLVTFSERASRSRSKVARDFWLES